ncbi:zinc finger protein 235-like [Labeo rohita]|uniref:zinc finger protein 235-like n=1 Tax=Labeo rohita TaxID=84645 RepID=UPI0021E32F3B|nr:zinc finger protein 235-like [Labeo rohita]
MDLHTGQSSAYSSKPSQGQWKGEIQESEEEQEASVTTQSKDMDVNVKVWQSKNSKRSKRVYECPVCHKRFAAPSKLKRHHLIHTNQRPFQCSICSSAFRERSHLKVHFRTMHRDQNMIIENIQPQKMSVDCNDSDLYFSISTSPLETVENKSEVIFQCNNKSLWGLTHETDILLDGKKTSDIVPFGRVSDCPPKTDSSLRHCASESRTEENWAHQMGDVEDCAFVDSDTGKCVPDSSLSSSCQYQQKPDVPRLPEVVVELEDFEDPEECFPNSPHDLPVCPDCSQCFPTVMDLYAHNCANRYPEGKTKKSHQCDICFKFFSAPSKLKRHRVTHTGQRPFQCTQCQKSFTQPHHLKNHMLSHR